MDRRHLLLGLMALPAVAHAEAKPPVKLTKVFPYLDKYFSLPPAQRDRFSLAYTYLLNGKPAAGLKGAIIHVDGQRVPFGVGADGRVMRLPTAAELQTGMLALELPASAKIGVSLDLFPSLPPAKDMAPRDLDAAMLQANTAIARLSGALSFAAPKMVAVGFEGVSAGTAVFADGRQMALPSDKEGLFYAPAKMPGAVRLSFAHAPSRLEFRDKT